MLVASPWKCLLIATLVAAGMARGETINWYCASQKANLTSTGQTMDGGFQFQLGVFSGGFVPTPGNASQWATYWVSAQTASYSPATRAFDSSVSFEGNVAPFSIGAKAYIWGRRAGATGDEWILFRKSDWTWPNGATVPPDYHDWSAASANEVVLGSINASGIPHLMKSEAVYSYNQWRDVALAGEPQNGPNDDPDRDGVSNLLEFVFGAAPKLAGALPVTPVEVVTSNSQKFQQFTLPRRIDRLATLTVQVSPDLTSWTSGPAATVVISDTPAALVVRDLTPLGAGTPKRFIRLKAELPTP